MITINDKNTAYASSVTIEMDASAHLASMKLAQMMPGNGSLCIAVANDNLNSDKTAPVPQERLSTTEKFYRNQFQNMTDENKLKYLRDEIDKASNPLKAMLKEKGFKLEVEYYHPLSTPREHNAKLWEN